MDPRFGSIALLTLVLTYPSGRVTAVADDGCEEEDVEVGDIFEVYLETHERRIGEELPDLYSAYNDLTECISKLTIKIHSSGLNTSENASTCFMINADYKKAIHDLLQVSIALLSRIALSLGPATGGVERAFKLMRHVWPPKNLNKRREALQAATNIWRLNVNELYSKNIKIRKLTAEINNTLSYLWSICDRLLSVQITKGSQSEDVPQIKAAIRWSADEDMVGISVEDAVAIRNDLARLAEAQSELAGKIGESADYLDSMEHTNAITAGNTLQAVNQLAQASKLQTSKWPFTCAAVGAAIGSAIGLIGGPPGILIGASAGGALGGSAGKALKNRHHEVMTQVIRRGSFPSDLNSDGGGTSCESTKSIWPFSAADTQEADFQENNQLDRAPFSPDTKEAGNRAVWLGCHSVPVLLDRPKFQKS